MLPPHPPHAPSTSVRSALRRRHRFHPARVRKGVVGALLLATWAASLQSAFAQKGGSASAEEPPPDRKAQAGARLDEGVRLYRQGQYEAALAEFREARRLYPFLSALFNAALCLEKLGRQDEALELVQTALREIDESAPDGPADKERAQRRVIELRRKVGTLEIEGAEPGATLVVDGRIRGEYPLDAPLRVVAGSHLVRALKVGFEPFETRVEVAGGATERVAVSLRALERSGSLRVEEKGGHAVTVVIDGNPVGKAPWEGRLAPGTHVIVLRGEGDLGTPPVPVLVEVDRTVLQALTAEALAGSLRVEPTPVNAAVAIDKVVVGNGTWDGRLREGDHTIEVSAPGFLAESRSVTLTRGGHPVLRVELQRDPDSPFAPPASHFIFEATTSFVLAPLLSGDVDGQCDEACRAMPGLGGALLLHGGYQLRSGLSVGVSVGYLAAVDSAGERRAAITPVGQLPEIVRVDDSTVVRSGLAGAWVGLSLRSLMPIHIRLGAGALFGLATDARSGKYDLPHVEPAGEQHRILGLYLAPEVQVGMPVRRGVELTAGVGMIAAFLPSPPAWSASHNVVLDRGHGAKDQGTFADTFAGPILAITPGLGVRFEL